MQKELEHKIAVLRKLALENPDALQSLRKILLIEVPVFHGAHGFFYPAGVENHNLSGLRDVFHIMPEKRFAQFLVGRDAPGADLEKTRI